MKITSKFSILLAVFLLMFQTLSLPVSAMSGEGQEEPDNIQAIIISDKTDEQVPLFEEETETSETLLLLEADDEVTVLQQGAELSFIQYKEGQSEEIYEGYVFNHSLDINEKGNLPDESEADDTAQNKEDQEISQKDEEESKANKSPVDSHKDEEDKQPYTENEQETDSDELVEENNEPTSDDTDNIDDKNNQNEQSNNKTSNDDSSNLTKANLTAQTAQKTLYGIALKDSTNVYKNQSKDADVLKSYEQGSTLKFKTLSSQWYEATVSINGQYTTGYIHQNDVEILSNSQATLQGIGLKPSTNVYQKASAGSNVLKSYDQGTVLKYRTFSTNWYEATVYVNGKRKSGYIHKSDVENAVTDQVSLKGIASNAKTHIYQHASTGSNSWKSYPEGSVLSYRTFSTNWYEATVYVNGKRKTGYIHKSHVKNADTNPVSLKGIALKDRTHVYKGASTGFQSWKSYSNGSILAFQTFSDNWYEATVYVNGQRKTGYIPKSSIEEAVVNQNTLTGFALKKPTTIYSKATKNSSSLKSYSYGSKLKFKTFSKNWYEATVYINGQGKTGYIHAKDITFEDVRMETNYNLTLAEALGIQMTATPQTTNEYNTFVSKTYIDKDHKVTADTLNVRGGPGTNYWVVGQLTKGNKVNILKETDRWYQIEYTNKHQFVNASPDDVLYYLNPANLVNDTKQQFQFLDLSRNSAATADVLNKYLQGKGTLSGQGKAFIDAGNKHGISDVYLISHAILETGNGSSTLATGVKYNGVTVYNMFGIGAYDSCPTECGAKRAYEEGWTTPSKAIVGGAQFIGNSYIKSGLNTLYKMRWNPQAMALTGAYGKQYATDIGWAAKQVNNMYNLYQQLDSYVLFLDIPTYKK